MSQRVVLDAQDIERCLRRIAHEILESNEGHEELNHSWNSHPRRATCKPDCRNTQSN